MPTKKNNFPSDQLLSAKKYPGIHDDLAAIASSVEDLESHNKSMSDFIKAEGLNQKYLEFCIKRGKESSD